MKKRQANPVNACTVVHFKYNTYITSSKFFDFEKHDGVLLGIRMSNLQYMELAFSLIQKHYLK